MGNTTKKAFPVLNMHCAGCANNVEKTVKKLPGVIEASVNFATNTLTVSYEKEQLTPGEIRAAVLAAGYDLIVEEAHKEERREEEQHKRYTRLKWKVIGAWILVVPLLGCKTEDESFRKNTLTFQIFLHSRKVACGILRE